MTRNINPKVTIITTVYNKEELIHKCISSVLAQSFTDFEYILVDDASTDNSPQICDDYAKADNRIKVIHRENGGHAIARNTGILHATGEYLTFLDGDDYFCDNHGVEEMVRLADENKSDIVITDFLSVWNEANKPKITNSTGLNILEYLLKEDIYHPTPCSRLFKRAIFDNNLFKNLISDDEEWTPKAFYYAEKVCIMPKLIYFRTTPDNSVTRINTEKNYFRKANDKALTAGMIIKFFEGENISLSQKKILYKRFVSLYLSSLHIYANVLSDVKLKKDLLVRLDENKFVLKYSRMSKSFKHDILYWIAKYFGLNGIISFFRYFSR
ncbi:glycosyltransferase family 2 protein [Flavobacterium sp. F-328]|uniref:Glycosyltransferase family 2 protein n=1 Tax=Flavobacterium erciyesense TaxID=2825842 RepID=A0ABS5D6R9_9FLAO|nr:glycosyltransferase family 2 protein [Flavobacterium erciyesense]MBQ0909635.1 glycosyltransferase family 2 protein [Flavobacterium erciyesense]